MRKGDQIALSVRRFEDVSTSPAAEAVSSAGAIDAPVNRVHTTQVGFSLGGISPNGVGSRPTLSDSSILYVCIVVNHKIREILRLIGTLEQTRLPAANLNSTRNYEERYSLW